MGKRANASNSIPASQIRRPTTPEARENQLIDLAIDLAEKQLRNGTASSQVITHYLKLGSTKERLEKELMETQKNFVNAKTESLLTTRHDTERLEELFQQAINAQREYNGEEVDENE